MLRFWMLTAWEGEAAAAWRPVEAGLVAPGGLGFEVGVADGGGVGVVEVDVGGETEAVPCGGSEARGVGESVGCGDAWGEDVAVAGEDFVAGSEGEGEAAECAEAEVSVACALVAGVLAEGVGVDGVAVGFEAVGEGGVGGDGVGAA